MSKVYKEHGHALAGTILASYYFSKRDIDSLSRVVERALTSTDVPAIKADAFMWIARGKHLLGQDADAASFFNLARQTQPDMLSASIGIGQLQLARGEITDAKLTFESVLEKYPKSIEACAALGTLYVNEVLDPTFKGDARVLKEKARALLDRAITLVTEHKQREFTDASLQLAKAMVADEEQPVQTRKLLEQAADIQKEVDGALSPEVLNNMANINQQEDHNALAEEQYAKALEVAEARGSEGQQDATAISTAIKYNLGRCAEKAGDIAKARATYEEVLSRQPNYVDAIARLAYLAYVDGDKVRSDELSQQMLTIEPNNVETRALHGWLLNRTKTRVAGRPYHEDPEMRHHDYTLKHIDNLELYSMIAVGNFWLRSARESGNDRNKQLKHYELAVKFFEKTLQIDAHNAYAAQGLAIAYVEQREHNRALAIFNKVRETLVDESIFFNLGHCHADLRQWTRAIECYEKCLNTWHNGRDALLFQCLGRIWFNRGREERDYESMRQALHYTKLAREMLPDNPSVDFNIAFVQFQTADILRNQPEIQRTVKDLQEAAAGLQDAIKTFGKLAESKHPPTDREELRQRAQMGTNTTTRQLERAIQQQTEYERRNADKVEEARSRREQDRLAREKKAAELQAQELEKQAALTATREKMQEEASEWIKAAREAAEQEREKEQTKKERAAKRKSKKADRDSDSDGDLDSDGEPKPKRKNTRKRQDDSDIEGIVGDDEEIERDGAPRKKARSSKKSTGSKGKKKRTLRGPATRNDSDEDTDMPDVPSDDDEDNAATARKRKSSKKYISAELVDSDLDDDDGLALPEKVNGKEMPLNQLANEHMLDDDRETAAAGTDDIHTKASGAPQAPASASDNAPVTNGPGATSATSVLLRNGNAARLEDGPGIGLDGQAPPTSTAGADD